MNTSAISPERGRSSIEVWPVVHDRIVFAAWVSCQLRRLIPAAVAVEIPEELASAMSEAVDRLPAVTVLILPDSFTKRYLLVHPGCPMVEAVRTAREMGIPWFAVDRLVPDYGDHTDHLADPLAAETIGCEAYSREHRSCEFPASRGDTVREHAMIQGASRISGRLGRTVAVVGLAHWRRVEDGIAANHGEAEILPARAVEVQQRHLSHESAREVLPDVPSYIARYEQCRHQMTRFPGRWEWYYDTYREAAESYRKRHGQGEPGRRSAVTLRYAKKLAAAGGLTAPDWFDFLQAAKACVHDDFARELWERTSDYSYQRDRDDRLGIDLSVEDVYPHSRVLRFQPRIERRKRSLLNVVRRREHDRSEWEDQWQRGMSQCSYQPEDEIVERYAKTIMDKTVTRVFHAQRRIREFAASLGDGIDFRETLRHYGEDKIFIREETPVRAAVGALLMVFDNAAGTDRYPWAMTWQGEHDQESDMAFLATDPEDGIIGPGIARAEYGAVLMTYPPGRMFHVFEDPYFNGAADRLERMMLAALDYTAQKIITYVAPVPPPRKYTRLAQRMGLKIVYLPVGSLSPVMIEKIRCFHVLKGHDVRRYANKYINPVSV